MASVGFGVSSSSPYTSSSSNCPKTKFKVVSTITTNEGSSSAPRRKRRMQQHPSPQEPKQRKPSVYEVQKAIGIVDEDNNPRPDVEGGSPSMMDLMTLTSVGQKEGPIERKFRETAEWVVEQTDDRALSGQKLVLMVCLRILPVWVLLLLVASGAIRLPFNIPFLDALLS